MSQSQAVRPSSPSQVDLGATRFNDIHFIGDIFCDLLAKRVARFPDWGGDVSAEISIMPGGSCLNSICHCSEYCKALSLHIKTAIFSSVGNDHQGSVCQERLRQAGVSTTNVKVRKDLRTGTCIVISGPDNRSFITDAGCCSQLSYLDFPEEELFRCGHVHISGFYNVFPLREQTRGLFQEAKRRGITTSLNCQYDNTKKWDLIADICPFLDILVGNTSEIEGITGSNIEAEWVRHILYEKKCQVLIVTKGEEGVSLFVLPAQSEASVGLGLAGGGGEDPIIDPDTNHSSSSRSSKQPGEFRRAEVFRGDRTEPVEYYSLELSSYNVKDQFLDCTGAGDAFVGGFLAKWISLNKSFERKYLYKSLQAGCICGATAVTCFGGCYSNQERLREIYSRILPEKRIEDERAENKARSRSESITEDSNKGADE